MTIAVPIIKVNTLGGTGCGKTSIVEVLHERWNGLTTSTLGVGIQEPLSILFTQRIIHSIVQAEINYDAKFVIWDIGGQTKYRDLLNDFLPGSWGQIGVIDGLNPRSVESLLAQLFLSAQIIDPKTPLLMLVSKADLFNGLKAMGDEFKAINTLLATTILDSLNGVKFPLDEISPTGHKQCLINYWILEQSLIKGTLGKGGIEKLVAEPVKLPQLGEKTINLGMEFGLDNLKLLARYLLLFLLEPEKPDQRRLFHGKISEVLPQIEFDRPGLIKPDNEKRSFLVDALPLKIILANYQTNKATTITQILSLIISCYSGAQQALNLKETLSSMTEGDIQTLASRYKQNITLEQANTIKNWVQKAKVYEVTTFEPFLIKNIIIDFFKDIYQLKIHYDTQPKQELTKQDVLRQLAAQRRKRST